MPHDGHCEHLHANPPECEDSYADSLGVYYDRAALALMVYFALTAFAVLVTSVRVFRAKGCVRLSTSWTTMRTQFDIQVWVFALVCISMLVSIPRVLDPFGLNNELPLWLIIASYDVGGTAILVIILIIVYSWVAAIAHVTGGRGVAQRRARRVLFGIGVVNWVLIIPLGQAQAFATDFWLYQGLKNMITAGSLGGLGLLLLWAGWSLTTILNDAQKMHKGKERTDKTIGRIRRLIVLSSLLAFAVSGVSVYRGSIFFQERPTVSHPVEPPKTAFDMAREGFYDYATLTACLITAYFFRRLPPKRSSRSGSRPLNGPPAHASSRQLRYTHGGASKPRTPRSPRARPGRASVPLAPNTDVTRSSSTMNLKEAAEASGSGSNLVSTETVESSDVV